MGKKELSAIERTRFIESHLIDSLLRKPLWAKWRTISPPDNYLISNFPQKQ